MKLYKLYNKSKEEISFKITKENIIDTNKYSRSGVSLDIDNLNDIDTDLLDIIEVILLNIKVNYSWLVLMEDVQQQ